MLPDYTPVKHQDSIAQFVNYVYRDQIHTPTASSIAINKKYLLNPDQFAQGGHDHQHVVCHNIIYQLQ